MNLQDIVFSPHGGGIGDRAVVEFENGFGASIVTGCVFFHTSEGAPYELAVLHSGHIDYATSITDDVLGHLTKENVIEILRKIEALEPREK